MKVVIQTETTWPTQPNLTYSYFKDNLHVIECGLWRPPSRLNLPQHQDRHPHLTEYRWLASFGLATLRRDRGAGV